MTCVTCYTSDGCGTGTGFACGGTREAVEDTCEAELCGRGKGGGGAAGDGGVALGQGLVDEELGCGTY